MTEQGSVEAQETGDLTKMQMIRAPIKSWTSQKLMFLSTRKTQKLQVSEA